MLARHLLWLNGIPKRIRTQKCPVGIYCRLEGTVISETWYPQTDSNRYLLLRTELFYPLNYGDSSSRTPLSRFAYRQKLRLTATILLSKAQTVDYAPWFGLLG